MRQIIDVNKSKITETQQLKIDISKLKVNIHMLNNELEETKKKLEEKEKLNNIDSVRNSVEGSATDDLNDLREKNRILEEENILIRQELENERAKNKDEDENEGKKGGKYNLFVSYVSQLMKEMKPNGNKEEYLCKKLKGLLEKEEKEKEKGENATKK